MVNINAAEQIFDIFTSPLPVAENVKLVILFREELSASIHMYSL